MAHDRSGWFDEKKAVASENVAEHLVAHQQKVGLIGKRGGLGVQAREGAAQQVAFGQANLKQLESQLLGARFPHQDVGVDAVQAGLKLHARPAAGFDVALAARDPACNRYAPQLAAPLNA